MIDTDVKLWPLSLLTTHYYYIHAVNTHRISNIFTLNEVQIGKNN